MPLLLKYIHLPTDLLKGAFSEHACARNEARYWDDHRMLSIAKLKDSYKSTLNRYKNKVSTDPCGEKHLSLHLWGRSA